jgi:hypothetical protein
MVGILADKISEYFRREDVREALREEIRRQERAEREGKESPAASINARIAELDRKIEQGSKKWLTAPPSLTEILGRTLEEWRKEREQLHAERRELAKPAPSLAELESAVDEILATTATLRKLLETDLVAAKVALRKIVHKVECRFTHTPHGTQKRSKLSGGVIHIRDDVLLCRPVQLGLSVQTGQATRVGSPSGLTPSPVSWGKW